MAALTLFVGPLFGRFKRSISDNSAQHIIYNDQRILQFLQPFIIAWGTPTFEDTPKVHKARNFASSARLKHFATFQAFVTCIRVDFLYFSTLNSLKTVTVSALSNETFLEPIEDEGTLGNFGRLYVLDYMQHHVKCGYTGIDTK